MARPIRIHADFRRDFSVQVDWLRRHADSSWLDRLDTDLDRIAELIGTYPAAGTVAARSGTVVLRRVVFPTTPYLTWYAYDEGDSSGEAWIVRLFHSRQHRLRPQLSRWLPAIEDR